MSGEAREIARRALIVALGLALSLPAAWGFMFLSITQGKSIESNPGLWVVLGSFVAFFVGRALVNWVFLKS